MTGPITRTVLVVLYLGAAAFVSWSLYLEYSR